MPPPKVTVSVALTLKVPAAGLLIVSVYVATHDPSACLVGPDCRVTGPNVPGAPPGKLTVGSAKMGVPVVPSGKAVTVMVKVSDWLTTLVGVSGVISIRTSGFTVSIVGAVLASTWLEKSPVVVPVEVRLG